MLSYDKNLRLPQFDSLFTLLASAVQEERQKVLTQSEMLSDRLVSTTLPGLVPISSLAASVILDAELAAEAADIEVAEFADLTSDDDAVLCDAVDKHLLMLVEWARHLPPFMLLPLPDQVALLRSGLLCWVM